MVFAPTPMVNALLPMAAPLQTLFLLHTVVTMVAAYRLQVNAMSTFALPMVV